MEIIDKTEEILKGPLMTMSLPECPHVHIHCYTTDDDVIAGESGVSELCCHGCGDAIFVTYNNAVVSKYPKGAPLMAEIADDFIDKHTNCVELDKREEYSDTCKSFRRNTTTMDISNL